MAGQTSPVGVNESLAEAKTLWIGDLAYWCDETWLTSLFVGARHSPRAPLHSAKKAHGRWLLLMLSCHVLPLAATPTAGGMGACWSAGLRGTTLCPGRDWGAGERQGHPGQGDQVWAAYALHINGKLVCCSAASRAVAFTMRCVAAHIWLGCSLWCSASAGYGFITFSSHTVAESVLGAYNGVPIPNTDLVFRLNWAAFGVGKITSEGAPRYARARPRLASGAMLCAVKLLRVQQLALYTFSAPLDIFPALAGSSASSCVCLLPLCAEFKCAAVSCASSSTGLGVRHPDFLHPLPQQRCREQLVCCCRCCPAWSPSCVVV